MDSREREALAASVLGYSHADESEVIVLDADSALTRFTHNAIHQNVAHGDASVQLRAVAGKRTGVASTNKLDDRSLRELADRALALARFAPKDEALPALPAAASYHPPHGAYVRETAEATPHFRAEIAAHMFEVMDKHDLWSAGFVTTGRNGVTVANSRGLQASFDGTEAIVNIKANAPTSSGYAEAYAGDASCLDGARVAAVAAAKATASADPVGVDPGDWTVIVEPAAFGELFAYVTDHFSAQAYDEGSSFISDGLDERYMGANVTVRDDYMHPLMLGMPFDFEGTPKERTLLIENGIARNVVTDSYWAAKIDRRNTGHALPAPNSYGPQALNVVIDPGHKSTEQLIAETQRGLLITRFWYIRPVDQRKTIVTGMTRDGLFLIEHGKVTRGVRNMRFNQSILEALRSCELSNELRRTGGFNYSIAAPAAKFAAFTFSSGTDF